LLWYLSGFVEPGELWAIRRERRVLESVPGCGELASMEEIRPSHGIVRFGAFELDFRASELRKKGTKIKLQEQPFQILQVLLQRPGETVTREELQQKIWPSNTFVDFDHGLYNAIKRLREALGDSAESPRFVETLSRRGYRFIGKIERETSRIRSLAVLPLENLSRDPEQEYFAEGLTEALITTLAKIGELRVVSRTSAMQYTGVRKPLREIARGLEVDAIVEGTVLRAGRRVRITAQLIDASRETHLWAESYERDLRNVLALQSEVAQAIAREIRVKLTPQEQAHFAQVQPVAPKAYEAYLRGRYYWNRRSGEGFGKAIQYFEQAIAEDPTYAAAYAGLADCLSILALWSLVSPDEGCGKAKGLALQALEIDSSLAEAHASLAWATMLYDYDFAAAEREFERSIELNPRYATAHQWFGMSLALMGRYEEGYTELKRAIRLDPSSSVIQWGLGFVCLFARRYDQAIEQFEKALQLDPNSAQAHNGLGLAYLYKSMHQPAVAAFRKAEQLSQGALVAFLGDAYAAAGNPDGAQKTLEQLKELSKQRYVSPYLVGRIHTALGNKVEALRWLETGYGEHDAWMAFLKTDPRFDDLRSDPRFQDLLRRMNFPA
jgi:TolB-like protein/Tfp pilus assembly protein PilF